MRTTERVRFHVLYLSEENLRLFLAARHALRLRRLPSPADPRWQLPRARLARDRPPAPRPQSTGLRLPDRLCSCPRALPAPGAPRDRRRGAEVRCPPAGNGSGRNRGLRRAAANSHRTSAPDPRLPWSAAVRWPGGRRSGGIPTQRGTAPRQDRLVADARASTTPRPPGSGAGRLRVAPHARFRAAGGAQSDGRAHGGDIFRVAARAPERACRYGRRPVLRAEPD